MCITTTRPLHCHQQQKPQQRPQLKRRLFMLPTQRQRRTTTVTSPPPPLLLPPVTKKRRLSKISFPDHLVSSSHTIPSRSDLTAEEAQKCYYKKKELRLMKSRATSAMRQHEQQQRMGSTCCPSPPSPPTVFCTRGLERRSRQGAKQFRQNKTKGWRAVFLEQARQRKTSSATSSAVVSSSSDDSDSYDCTDTDTDAGMDKQWLAKIYQQVTEPSLWAAQEVAARDAQQAAQIHLISSSSAKNNCVVEQQLQQ